jgi:hypothetical protein
MKRYFQNIFMKDGNLTFFIELAIIHAKYRYI